MKLKFKLMGMAPAIVAIAAVAAIGAIMGVAVPEAIAYPGDPCAIAPSECPGGDPINP